MSRHMIITGKDGDVEFVWDKDQDDAVRAMIEKKLSEGVRFMIRKPILGSKLTRTKEIKKVSQIKGRHVVAKTINDQDVRDLFTSGKVEMARSDDRWYAKETPVVSTSPDEIMQSQSVGLAPMRGG